jgi:hypothetical protein
MTRYHINAKGEPGVCHAKRKCPFGGEDQHYPSQAAARRGFEKSMEGGETTPAPQRLRGATGALLVTSPSGHKFVVKRRGAPRNEFAADQVYRCAQKLGLMGTLSDVPASQLIETEGGNPARISSFIENTTPLHILPRGEKLKSIREIQKGFAVDALIRNWDVPGMEDNFVKEASNVLVSADGRIHRIDSGGSFDSNALGTAQKPGGYPSGIPTDVWTMRDPYFSEFGAEVYGEMDFQEVVQQMEEISKHGPELANAAGHDFGSVTLDRIHSMGKIAQLARRVHGEGHSWESIDEAMGDYVRTNVSSSEEKFLRRIKTHFSLTAAEKSASSF